MNDKRVTKTIRKVMPAVVSIVIEKHLRQVEKEMPHEMYSFMPASEHNRKKTFDIRRILADGNPLVKVGGGTGFIVDPKGLVLTNKHVIEDPNADYVAVLNDGRKIPVEIASRDPINDVAILRIKAKGRLPFISLGSSSKLVLGQSVIAIGNALGVFKNTVSLGIVSGLSRAVTAQDDDGAPPQELRGLIQTDAAINVGNSGGPLVDLNGKAIGVNAAVIPGSQNIGFAIPINAAKRDLEDMKKYGEIRRPYLGLRYIVIDENLKDKMGLTVDYGAYVIPETPHDPGVAPNSPADRAGLKEKDIVLECNGKKVNVDHPIQDYLEDARVGSEFKMLILRGAKKFKTVAKLVERKQ